MVKKSGLRLQRKGLKLSPKRKIDKSLLLQENKGKRDMNQLMKSREVEKKWKELFTKCYDYPYKVSGKEKGMINKLCNENLVSEILASMSVMFFNYVSDEWWQSTGQVPSLASFVNSYDKWKSQGYKVIKSLSSQNGSWWLINETGISLSKISGKNVDFDKVLKIEKDHAGRFIAYEVSDGKTRKRRVAG